jgi:hypothetical protein
MFDKTNSVEGKASQERILARKIAMELDKGDLEKVVGGHVPPEGETCSGNDCDIQHVR